MMRRWTWAGMALLAGGLFLFQGGCAEQKPKTGGNTSVDPALTAKPGVPATTTPATTDDTAQKATPVEKAAPTDDEAPAKSPDDIGSTTGGGTELPESSSEK